MKASGAGSQTPSRASFPAILSLRSPWLPFLSAGSGCWGNRGPNQKSRPWFAAYAAARGVNAPPRPKSSHRLEVTGMTFLGWDGHVQLLLARAISARQCSPPAGAHFLSLPHLRSVPGSPGSAPCSQAVSGVLRLGLPCPQGSSAFFSLPSSHVLPLAKSPPATASSSSPTVFTFILSPSSSEWPLCAPHRGDGTDLAPGLTDLMAERMDRAHWEIAGGPELRILREREVKGPNPMAGAIEGSRGQAGLSRTWAGEHKRQRREGGSPG